jgi:hypothetical protein
VLSRSWPIREATVAVCAVCRGSRNSGAMSVYWLAPVSKDPFREYLIDRKVSSVHLSSRPVPEGITRWTH